MSTYDPTPEQNRALKLYLAGHDLKIEACAGSGKTSTVELLARASDTPSLYMAFNKAIQEEADSRMPDHVLCKTMHGLAYPEFGALFEFSRLRRGLRTKELAKFLGLNGVCTWGATALKSAAIVRAGLLKFCSSDDPILMVSHCERLECETSQQEREWAQTLPLLLKRAWAFATDQEAKTGTAFDVYLKLWALSDPGAPKTIVFLDEAQDSNPVILGVLERWRQAGTQVIYVGDAHQQIYSFRGAVNAMSLVEGCQIAPLTRSFRYGPAIAELANKCLNALKGVPSCIVGHDIDSRVVESYEGIPRAVLCRTNAGVIERALDFSSRGITVHISGGVKDLISNLKGCTNLLKGEYPNTPLLNDYESWDELYVASEEPGGEELKRLMRLVDKYGAYELTNILRRISKTPQKDAQVHICTAHKSKGLQWEIVEINDDFPVKRFSSGDPNPRWTHEEANLLYVAITRAQHTLVVRQCESIKEVLTLDLVVVDSTTTVEPEAGLQARAVSTGIIDLVEPSVSMADTTNVVPALNPGEQRWLDAMTPKRLERLERLVGDSGHASLGDALDDLLERYERFGGRAVQGSLL